MNPISAGAGWRERLAGLIRSQACGGSSNGSARASIDVLARDAATDFWRFPPCIIEHTSQQNVSARGLSWSILIRMSGSDLPDDAAHTSGDEPFVPSKEASERIGKAVVLCLIPAIALGLYFAQVGSTIGIVATIAAMTAISAFVGWRMRNREMRRWSASTGRPANPPQAHTRTLAVGGAGLVLMTVATVLATEDSHNTLLLGATGLAGALFTLWAAALGRTDSRR